MLQHCLFQENSRYNGDKLLLKTDMGDPAQNQVVAGLVSSGLTLSNEMIDVTTKDSNGFTQKLPGLTSASVSGNGIFTDDASHDEINSRALSGAPATYTIINTDSNKSWIGEFLISSFEVTGDTTGAVQFSISLESTGPVTFV